MSPRRITRSDPSAWQRPTIPPEEWFDKHLWRWHPNKADYAESLREFLLQFRPEWDRNAAYRKACWIYHEHGWALKDWRELGEWCGEVTQGPPTFAAWLRWAVAPTSPENVIRFVEEFKARVKGGELLGPPTTQGGQGVNEW
jgi:hypothetical protein